MSEAERFERFQCDVRQWIELDKTIKILIATLKERRDAKKIIGKRILEFMARNNIDDLDTYNGRLRIRIEYVKKPLTPSIIRSRLTNALENVPATDICDMVLERGVQERTSLKLS